MPQPKPCGRAAILMIGWQSAAKRFAAPFYGPAVCGRDMLVPAGRCSRLPALPASLPAEEAEPRKASAPRLLLLQRQAVRDHRDKLRIRGLALDIAHRVAEVLLQHLDIAAVPGDLDGVADFRDFRPERRGPLSVLSDRQRQERIYWLIHWLGPILFVGTLE